MNETTIDLNLSVDAKKLMSNELVHHFEFSLAKELISNGLKKARLASEEEYEHETITILGTRGSGKTTFLLSLLEEFRYKDSEFAVPDIVDPTLIEEKGHIFLTIISAIRLMVEKEREKLDFKDNEDFKAWDQALEKLANGIPSVDGVGGTLLENSWQDSEYILEKGIQSVSAALTLRIDFRNFVSKSLKVLKKVCFIIGFDDIDIDFKKGWPVLETIRKYFTFSNIICVLSGDLRFYSLAIRKQYWTNFGKALLLNEIHAPDQQRYFEGLITEMESQYMLKVLKPSRRIHLSTLYEKILLFGKQSSLNESPPRRILIKYSEENSVEIFEFYLGVLREFGIRNKYQGEAYYAYLLRLPIRTQLRFMAQFRADRILRSSSLIQAFLSDIIEKRVNINVIENSSYLLSSEILRMLVKERCLNDFYQLQPISNDPSLNGSLMALNLLSSKNYSLNNYNVFDYIIKIGFLRNLCSSLAYSESDNAVSAYTSPSINGLIWHASLYQDRVLRDCMGHLNAYLIGAFPSIKKWAGMISLPGLEEVAKEGVVKGGNKIDIVFRDYPIHSVIGFMPITISSYTTRNSSEVSYSIFTLLAGIGELIRKADLGDLMRGLSELSQIRIYPIPDFQQGFSDKLDMNLFEAPDFENYAWQHSRLFELIEKWILNRFRTPISPHFLGKVVTRFFYALKTIENNEVATNLGDMMHSRMIAFFNSIVIEEAREIDETFEGFNINNTSFSDSIFNRNLNNIIDRNDLRFEFSKWLLSCPLLLTYVNENTSAYKAISSFTGDSVHPDLRSFNLYSILTKVRAARNRQIRSNTNPENLYFSELADLLKRNHVPFDPFIESTDRIQTMENNKMVRNILLELANQEEWSSQKIRNFRKYLRKRNKKW